MVARICKAVVNFQGKQSTHSMGCTRVPRHEHFGRHRGESNCVCWFSEQKLGLLSIVLFQLNNPFKVVQV